jgi:hypothetical protein
MSESELTNPEVQTPVEKDEKSQVLTGVEHFDRSHLKPVTIQEKIVLPDKETIEQERKELESLAQ